MDKPRLIPLSSLVPPPSVSPPLDIFSRWKLSRDEKAAVKIDKELHRAGLPPEPLESLLVLGEAIAKANEAQADWKRAGARYTKLARIALDVGKVAADLSELIPPPWAGERQVLGGFVTSLADFLFCGVEVTAFAQHIATINAAQIAFAQLRESVPDSRGRVSDALIGRLAWLASNSDPDKRPPELKQRGAMRLYRGWKKPQGTRARPTWRRHLETLNRVGAGAGTRPLPKAFMAALETWLRAT